MDNRKVLAVAAVVSSVLILALSWATFSQTLKIRHLKSNVSKLDSDASRFSRELANLKRIQEDLPDTTPQFVSFIPRRDRRVDGMKVQWRFSGVVTGKGDSRQAEFLWQVDFINRDSFNHTVDVELEFLDKSNFKVAETKGKGVVFRKEGKEEYKVSTIRGKVLIPFRLASEVSNVEIQWLTY